MSSDITVDEARAVVAGWVRAQVAADPAFRGAFLTGSATDRPGSAPLPRSSDVDVTVLVAAPSGAAPSAAGSSAAGSAAGSAAQVRRTGKQLVDGVLVDVSYLDERALADPARVAASFVYAPSFRGGQVLADPTGHLGRLEAAIAPGFASPAAVRARTADVHRRIGAHLTALDPGATWADLVLHWLFPTSLTAVARLVAALRMPTVRLRYLRAREVTPPAEYERLLALLGCAACPPGVVARHVDAVAERFDEAAAVLAGTHPPPPPDVVAPAHPRPSPPPPAGAAAARGGRDPDLARGGRGPGAPRRGRGAAGAADARSQLPFAADLTAAARPVAIDGSRELVDGGDHREAVFWVVATAARCQVALGTCAPDLARQHEPGFRALVADLVGLRGPADLLTRRDALLAALS